MNLLLIEKIFHNTESKDGKPYRTKAGKSFTICNIKAAGEYYKFADFFGIAAKWEDGTEIDMDALGLEIVEKEWQGKIQKELQKVTSESKLLKRVEALEARMDKMAEWAKNLKL